MRWQRGSGDAGSRNAANRSWGSSLELAPMPLPRRPRPGMVVLAGVDGTLSGQAALRVAAARAAALDLSLYTHLTLPTTPYV
jgi:hypothetical protein